ncbi:hypothetical protein G3489_19490 [Shewanella baltica]|uniref:DUF6283 family protein n=1 Tax=Shewanella baltica TaxID=62322 RepID=UPI00217D5AAC|nr:DUF6283 family protein [Shewanella baltica]MCS6271861.1 hypothetical protein [Shewanella baltica]
MTSLPNCKKTCANCPFRKDAPKGWLGSDRMAEILEASSFVCHKKHHMQCAGHMLINDERNEFVRLAKRLNIPLDLSGRDLVFDTRVQCIEHHNY